MLSLFPEILFLAPFSAFFIRITLGFALGYIASRHVFVPAITARTAGVIEGVTAILLVAGAYTQAAAIVAFILILVGLFVPTYRALPRSTLLLLALLCLSLVVTGAGPFAFDLPL